MVTRFHLNICTVEVMDTGRHLTHLYFPIKVVLIMVIIPFSHHCQMRPNRFVWGLRLCNYLINTCTLKILLGQCFPKGQFHNFGLCNFTSTDQPMIFLPQNCIMGTVLLLQTTSLHIFTCRKATFYLIVSDLLYHHSLIQ